MLIPPGILTIKTSMSLELFYCSGLRTSCRGRWSYHGLWWCNRRYRWRNRRYNYFVPPIPSRSPGGCWNTSKVV